MIFQTSRAGRIDNLGSVSGPVGEAVRELGIRAAVGVPVSVEGAALTASRARIVATADATRRRIERNLHDGA